MSTGCRKCSTSTGGKLRSRACCCCGGRRLRASYEDERSACIGSRRWKMCMGRWTGSASASHRWLPCCRDSQARKSHATCICSAAVRFLRNRRELGRILREWRILREKIASPSSRVKWRSSGRKSRECRSSLRRFGSSSNKRQLKPFTTETQRHREDKTVRDFVCFCWRGTMRHSRQLLSAPAYHMLIVPRGRFYASPRIPGSFRRRFRSHLAHS